MSDLDAFHLAPGPGTSHNTPSVTPRHDGAVRCEAEGEQAAAFPSVQKLH